MLRAWGQGAFFVLQKIIFVKYREFLNDVGEFFMFFCDIFGGGEWLVGRLTAGKILRLHFPAGFFTLCAWGITPLESTTA